MYDCSATAISKKLVQMINIQNSLRLRPLYASPCNTNSATLVNNLMDLSRSSARFGKLGLGPRGTWFRTNMSDGKALRDIV